ncbi:cardiolipin synthase [Mesobacillus subterraneus]|uniref:cardiolipin synthase n=1 Tax=Mesobacillus subterraneus TaxID=285983 RepID=UPI002041DD9F|nr:cardiolipin synthase [Mesobacillus subterraneus]MCM3664593.1 cardiolipin synthase [Mesobacillus subterraneus]MCM3683892.1 cardiolipin synthase [Mesobacillus subterraneus]
MGLGSIIFLIIAGLALWVCADFMLGRKKHLANANTNVLPVRESNLEIFTKGPELFDNLFSEIKKAKQHIHILFYIVQDDKISQEFLSILKEKAQAGVEVRLLVDWVGSGLKRKTIQSLKDAGVEFAYSQTPKFPFLFYSSQVRNHRKISVIDGRIAYLGGFNIGKEYFNQDPKLSPWRDYHLKMTGEGVMDLQREFLKDWRAAAKVNLLQDKAYFPPLEKGPFSHKLIPTEGILLEELFSDLISQAQKSIFIGTPYFIPSKRVFDLLRNAIKRGVSVTVLVPFTADHVLVKEASLPYLRTLLTDGADVYQYLKGFYHAKIVLIDDKVCDVGTANFDKRSMFLNYELNCLIYDPDFIKKIKHILTEDILNSQKANLQDFNRVNPLLSIKETAARTISYFL